MDQINATTTENEWINQTAMERDTGACSPGSETYRVQRGDSFYLIARKFGVSVRALMNANPNIAAGHLLVGDILCVPVGEGRSCPVGSSAYTVQQGQSVVDVMLSSNVSLRALREYNEDIRLTALRPGDVLAYTGPMGAGKTTFTVGLARGLGSSDWGSSPTFALVQEYRGPVPLCHFDFYRIKKLSEVYDMGYEDYFYSGALCFIEWPELVEELLPGNAVKVTIEELEDGNRVIRL